ncbi:MAG TPA: HD-GYP domain-containing protein [Gammaproteobacteria bacterium]
MKIKLDVGSLRRGMFVAELDRPWLGTPFLFQGFLIESDDELEQLRECSRHVFVDDLQSSQSRDVQDALLAAAGTIRSGKVRAITVEFEEWKGAARLRRTLARLNDTVGKSRERIGNVIEDVRAGKSVKARETRLVASELVDTVNRNPQTAQWMTVLQSENRKIAQHSMNVSVLAAALGRFMEWNDALVSVMSEGALLHDAGMSRVPRWILDKPGPLTQREFLLVRMHADYAARRLEAEGDYDRRVIEIVRHHHERIDGSGYPAGLRGHEIPAYVQAVSMVDVYESMTADKPYEAAMTPSLALTRLHRRVDTHFDRRLVEAFIRCIGIYPLSSLVRLKNGALGIVISSQEENRLRPVLLLVRTPNGEAIMPRRMVNLAMMESQGMTGWGIEKIADPEAEKIDVRRILLDEFMLR